MRERRGREGLSGEVTPGGRKEREGGRKEGRKDDALLK
jgi:hypothetical protein